jgi:hypothetical protein
MIKVFQITDMGKYFDETGKTPFMYGMGNSFTGTDVLEGFRDGTYKQVCTIDTDDLNEAFEIGNIGPEEKITRLDRMHSLSVGDVLVREGEDDLLVVAPTGFVNLGLPLAEVA